MLAYLLSLKQPPLPTNEAAAGMASHARCRISTRASSRRRRGKTASAPVAAATPPAGGYDAAKGEQLFSANCSACHQATGEGVPGAFPPLKGNAVVNDADPSAHIHAVLFGLEDATVDGVKYESAMPEFGTTLSDDDIAAIIDYERSSWGNHGKPVTAQDVATERAKGK